jgi:RNA polymerase sigma-70 factor (ECF subfamily)
MSFLFGSRDPLADPGPLIDRVYFFVAYRLGSVAEAEDVTNEVFERAVRYRASFDPRKGSFLAWLFGIARRLISEAAAARSAVGLEEVEGIAPGDLAEDVVRRLTVAAAVAGLAERDRDLIALRYGADLTARQIGDVLGMSTHAVEVALHRTHDRLRAKLAEGMDEQASGQSVTA